MFSGMAEKRQEKLVNKAERLILKWAKNHNAMIHQIYTVPDYVDDRDKQKMMELYNEVLFGTSLDVLIVYQTDAELAANKENGMLEKTEQEFMLILDKIGYIKKFGNIVRVEFESDEIVRKNFEGNYGYRLRN